MVVCLAGNTQENVWDEEILKALEEMDQAGDVKFQQHVLTEGPHVIEVVGVFPHKAKNSGNPCLRWVCKSTSLPTTTICRFSPLLEHTKEMLRHDFEAFDIHLNNFTEDVRKACQDVVGRMAIGNITRNQQGQLIEGFKKL